MPYLLYIFFTLSFIWFGGYLSFKIKQRWFTVFIIVHMGLLLASAIYHTKFYDAFLSKEMIPVARDHLSGYFPHKHRDKALHTKKFHSVSSHILSYKYGHAILPYIYHLIRELFGPSFFYQAYYLACLLNASLHLLALYLLFKTLTAVGCSKRWMMVCFLILSSPYIVFLHATPLSESLSFFAMILFLCAWLSRTTSYLKILGSCFLLYTAHKVFYLFFPCMLLISMFFLRKKYRLIMYMVGVALSIFMFQKIIKSGQFYYNHYFLQEKSSGNSQLPPTGSKNIVFKIISRNLNIWYAPIWTGSHFFYKNPNGNILGWLYAIVDNCIFVGLSILLIAHLSYFRALEDKNKLKWIVVFLLLIIFSLGMALISVNYLTFIRHRSKAVLLWLCLVSILLGRKTTRNTSLGSRDFPND